MLLVKNMPIKGIAKLALVLGALCLPAISMLAWQVLRGFLI